MSSSFIAQRHSGHKEDCLSCRIISGSGVIGVGLYLGYHSKNTSNKAAKFFINLLAIGAIGLGSARLLNLPPFKKPATVIKEN